MQQYVPKMELWFQLWHCYADFDMRSYTYVCTVAAYKKLIHSCIRFRTYRDCIQNLDHMHFQFHICYILVSAIPVLPIPN